MLKRLGLATAVLGLLAGACGPGPSATGSPVAAETGSRPAKTGVMYVASYQGVVPVFTATGSAGHPIGMSSPVARLAITPDGRTVYAPDARSVVPINAMTGRAGKPIHVGYTPPLIVMAPDGKTAYAAGSSPSLTPVNTATNQAGRPFRIEPAGSFPAAIAITRTGRPPTSTTARPLFR